MVAAKKKKSKKTKKKKKGNNNSYSFLIRRRHSYKRRYKKVPISGIDILLGRAPKLRKEPEKKLIIEKEKKPKKLIPTKLIVVIVILLIIGGLFYIMPKGTPREAPVYNVPSGTLIHSAGIADIVNIGSSLDSLKNIAYMFLIYSTNNSTNTTLSIDLYKKYDTKEIYFLERARLYSPATQSHYSAFKNRLYDDATRYGYNFHLSDLTEIKTIKNSIIIIPSGRLPSELAEDGLIYNISRNNIVIYIGLQFNRINAPQGLINNENCVGTKCGDLEFISKDDRRFNNVCSGINLEDPEYTVLRTSATLPGIETIYGCILKVQYENGYLIFVPDALDYGWESGEDCAADIIKLIDESAWHKPISSIAYPINETSGQQTFFSGPFNKNIKNVFAKVKLFMQNPDHSSQKIVLLPINQTPLGILTISPYQTIPYRFSNREIELEIYTNEPEPSRQIRPYVWIKKNNVIKPEHRIPLMEMNSKEYPNSVPSLITINEPGEYVVEITDGSTLFASGYVRISDIVISADKIDFRRGNFKFSFKDEFGNSVAVSSVTVYLNDNYIDKFDRTSTVSFDVSSVSPGEQEFKFDFGGGNVKIYSKEYKPPNPLVEILSKPLNQGFLIITIIAVVIAFGIKRKERPEFSLDVPDFPPLAFKKAFIKPSEVMEIFEQINHSYSWKYMPLTLDEIKTGFMRYIHRGEQLVIGEYNLQAILDLMVDKGYIKEKNGYYLLSKWERESNKSAKLLTMYRSLRDIFVENTVRFSKLGVSKKSDLEITVSGEHMHLFIYDDNLKDIFNKIVKLIYSGKVLIIFDGEADKQEFFRKITSPSKPLMWLKLEIDSGEIIPLSIDELTTYIMILKGG